VNVAFFCDESGFRRCYPSARKGGRYFLVGFVVKNMEKCIFRKKCIFFKNAVRHIGISYRPILLIFSSKHWKANLHVVFNFQEIRIKIATVRVPEWKNTIWPPWRHPFWIFKMQEKTFLANICPIICGKFHSNWCIRQNLTFLQSIWQPTYPLALDLILACNLPTRLSSGWWFLESWRRDLSNEYQLCTILLNGSRVSLFLWAHFVNK